MSENVVIKSFPNGISVKLSDKPDFNEILQSTIVSFKKTASFFKDASVVLRFEGRQLSDLETEKLIHAINSVCQLHIICVVCTNKEENIYFSKLLEDVKKQEDKKVKEETLKKKDTNTFQFYKGSLKDGVTFENEGNVMVLGDVQKGAAVFAKGNVIVLGSIYGTVFAGKGGDDDRFIAALGYMPENLKIGHVKYKKEAFDKFTFNKKQPKIASIKNGKFTFSDLDFTKDFSKYNY